MLAPNSIRTCGALRGLCATLVLAFTSCGPTVEPPAQPRLVMLYATCTLNRDFLGAYNSGPSVTPNLDAFAREGVVFERHLSEAGHSGIAFASIFTGVQADRHGVYAHPTVLPAELTTVTETFAAAGYEPFFYSGHLMASHDLAYGQGVPDENVFDLGTRNHKRKIARMLHKGDALFRRILKKLDDDPDYRAFVLVDFTVTHHPYHRSESPEYYAEFLAAHPELAPGIDFDELQEDWALMSENVLDWRRDTDAMVRRMGWDAERFQRFQDSLRLTYTADVALLDALFGETLDLIEARGYAANSAIAFTADHGETLYREGTLFHWAHGLQLAREVLTVPWILRAPGVTPGRYAEVTRSIDVFPTLAGLSGIDVSPLRLDGTNLSSALRGEEPPPRQLAFSHTTKVGPMLMKNVNAYEVTRDLFGDTDVNRIWVRLQDRDMVYRWRNAGSDRWVEQAFDVSVDPLELVDIFDAANAEHADRLATLKAYKQKLVDAFESTHAERPADSYERLRALGYVSGDE